MTASIFPADLSCERHSVTRLESNLVEHIVISDGETLHTICHHWYISSISDDISRVLPEEFITVYALMD